MSNPVPLLFLFLLLCSFTSLSLANDAKSKNSPASGLQVRVLMPVLWIRNYFFRIRIQFSVEFWIRIWIRILLVKSFGSSFGSDPKHSLFHNANDLKWLFIDFKAYFSKKMLD
jgi:hypothetical protein